MNTALALVPPSLSDVVDGHQVWRGQPSQRAQGAGAGPAQPTGFVQLDAALPAQGWPESALTELLLPADGVGELSLLWPTLRRLACKGGRPVVLVAPPYVPYAPAWSQAGVDLDHLQVVHATSDADSLWAAEQCLRSGACSAVLCWPLRADDRALRRLQVAAQTGQCLGFVFRDRRDARNPSPAALRLELHAAETADAPTRVHVLKCRGGVPPNAHIPLLTVS